jgi:hypothetical protein
MALSQILRGVNAPLVKVDGKSVQLALQVQTIPEEDLIQNLAPHSPDKPLDEGVWRARHKGDGLVFLDLQDPGLRHQRVTRYSVTRYGRRNRYGFGSRQDEGHA